MNEEKISIYIGRYIHKITYNSALKKKEILPFLTTCMMNLEGLSERSQTRKTNTTGYHLYVKQTQKVLT